MNLYDVVNAGQGDQFYAILRGEVAEHVGGIFADAIVSAKCEPGYLVAMVKAWAQLAARLETLRDFSDYLVNRDV